MKKLSKLLLLAVLLVMAGCGAYLDTTVEYDNKTDKVVLTTEIELDSDDYEYVVGGKASVEKALTDNLWEGAEIEEISEGYEITTEFSSLDDYNEFMNEMTGSDGIEVESEVLGLGLEETYTFNENARDYINGYIEDVHASLEFTETAEVSDLVRLHYTSNYVGDTYVYGYNHTDYKEYELKSSSVEIKYNKEYTKGNKKIKLKSETVNVEFAIEIEKGDAKDELEENFKDLGFETSYKDKTLTFKKSFKDLDEATEYGDVYLSASELDCDVKDNSLFKTEYKCKEEDSYYDKTASIYINDTNITGDAKVSYFLDGENVTKEVGKRQSDLKIVNIIITAVVTIALLVGLFFGIKIFMKHDKEKGLVDKFSKKTKESFTKIKEEVGDKTKDSISKIKEEAANSKINNEAATVAAATAATNGETEEDTPVANKTTLLEKVNSFIDLKLVLVLLILFIPILSISVNSAAGFGFDAKGNIFFDGSLMKSLGISASDAELGFVNFMRIVLIISAIGMLVLDILQKTRTLSLTPFLIKLINIIFYSLILVGVLVFILKIFSYETDEIVLSFSYIFLLIIGIVGLVSAIIGLNFDNGLSIFNKYYIFLIVALSFNVLGMSLDSMFGDITGSFNVWLLAKNSMVFMIFVIIFIIAAIVFIVLNHTKKLNTLTNLIFVCAEFGITAIIFIYMLISSGQKIDLGFGVKIEISLILTFIGILVTLIKIGMVVLSAIALSKESGKKVKQAVAQNTATTDTPVTTEEPKIETPVEVVNETPVTE